MPRATVPNRAVGRLGKRSVEELTGKPVINHMPGQLKDSGEKAAQARTKHGDDRIVNSK